MTITSFGFVSCAKNFLSCVIMNAHDTNLTYASKDQMSYSHSQHVTSATLNNGLILIP